MSPELKLSERALETLDLIRELTDEEAMNEFNSSGQGTCIATYREVNVNGLWECTRTNGHEGQHIAIGLGYAPDVSASDRVCARWY